MPFCPACGEEYREGFTRCADCALPLRAEKPAPPEPPAISHNFFRKADKLPWPEGRDGQPERPVLLRGYTDRSAFFTSLHMLRGYGIPALDGTLADSAHLKVFLGSHMQSGDIFVPESLYEDALVLLEGGGELVEDGCGDTSETSTNFDIEEEQP